MELDMPSALRVVQSYFEITDPVASLGWGISGFVFLSPDTRSAVKIHRHEESFSNELAVYRKITELRITKIHGLTVPQLRDQRPDLNLLRMDCVSPPFLLDFAGALLHPPDFSDETMELWHAGLIEKFGTNVGIAYAVYDSLARQGIYYMDFRPSNMNLSGLPGLEPDAQDLDV